MQTTAVTGETGRSALERVGAAGDIDPHLAPFFEVWLDTFLFHGRLDPRLRELAILRVMWRCGQAFEWGNHYRIARNVGITKDDVLAIRTANPERDLEGPVALVVRAADEVVDAGCMSEETMAALPALFPRQLLSEFLFLVAGYRMFATVSASRREERTGSHEPWPPDGIAPKAPRAGR